MAIMIDILSGYLFLRIFRIEFSRFISSLFLRGVSPQDLLTNDYFCVATMSPSSKTLRGVSPQGEAI